MAKLKKTEFTVKFKVGDKVRVKRGFMDVDYPDMPMGGRDRHRHRRNGHLYRSLEHGDDGSDSSGLLETL